jgi:hypothetical protein
LNTTPTTVDFNELWGHLENYSTPAGKILQSFYSSADLSSQTRNLKEVQQFLAVRGLNTMIFKIKFVKSAEGFNFFWDDIWRPNLIGSL